MAQIEKDYDKKLVVMVENKALAVSGFSSFNNLAHSMKKRLEEKAVCFQNIHKDSSLMQKNEQADNN